MATPSRRARLTVGPGSVPDTASGGAATSGAAKGADATGMPNVGPWDPCDPWDRASRIGPPPGAWDGCAKGAAGGGASGTTGGEETEGDRMTLATGIAGAGALPGAGAGASEADAAA